jgi:hypothetical protein
VVRLAPERDHRSYPSRLAGLYVRLAEVAVVRQQRLRLAEFVGSAASLSSMGVSYCLSFGACTTSAATTNRLPAVTTACAL